MSPDTWRLVRVVGPLFVAGVILQRRGDGWVVVVAAPYLCRNTRRRRNVLGFSSTELVETARAMCWDLRQVRPSMPRAA